MQHKKRGFMKKCPICSKTYDDSWKVCLGCSKPLLPCEGKEENMPKEALPQDSKVVSLKQISFFDIIRFAVFFIMATLIYLIVVAIGYAACISSDLFGHLGVI